MKRILILFALLIVAWGSLTAPVVQPASAAAPIVSMMDGANGTAGLPPCNSSTAYMFAQNIYGVWHRCFPYTLGWIQASPW